MQHGRDEGVEVLGRLGVSPAQCAYLRLQAIEPALLLDWRNRHFDRGELVQAERPVATGVAWRRFATAPASLSNSWWSMAGTTSSSILAVMERWV